MNPGKMRITIWLFTTPLTHLTYAHSSFPSSQFLVHHSLQWIAVWYNSQAIHMPLPKLPRSHLLLHVSLACTQGVLTICSNEASPLQAISPLLPDYIQCHPDQDIHGSTSHFWHWRSDTSCALAVSYDQSYSRCFHYVPFGTFKNYWTRTSCPKLCV